MDAATVFRNKTYLLAGLGLLIVAAGLYTQPIFLEREHAYDNDMTAENAALRAQFNTLSTAGSNVCGAQPENLDAFVDGERMQGSCCAPMSFHSYKEQITGLEQYADYELIPSDPYNVSVTWAKEMIAYNEETTLNAEQQAVYDEATELSHEGGPCCCVCWHWYAYAGLGKKLIVEHDFTAEQVAELWDLSDACGGSHTHT